MLQDRAVSIEFKFKGNFNELDKAENQIKKLKNSINDLERNSAKKLGSSGGGFLGGRISAGFIGTLAGAVATSQAIKSVVELDDAFIELSKKTDWSRGQMEAFKKEVFAMRQQVNMSTPELVLLTKELKAADVADADLLNTAKTITQIATASGGEALAIFQDLNRVAKTFDQPISKLREMGDALAYLDSNSSASSQNIVDTMARASGSMKNFSLDWRQGMGLSAAAFELTGQSEQAGSALRLLMDRIGNASSLKTDKKFMQGLSAIGISDVKQIKPTYEGLLDVLKRMQKIDPNNRAEIFSYLFGRGLDTSNLTNFVSKWDVFIDRVAKASDSTKQVGILDKQNAKELDKISAKWALLKDQLVELFSGQGAVASGMRGTLDLLNATLKATIETSNAIAKGFKDANKAEANYKGGKTKEFYNEQIRTDMIFKEAIKNNNWLTGETIMPLTGPYVRQTNIPNAKTITIHQTNHFKGQETPIKALEKANNNLVGNVLQAI